MASLLATAVPSPDWVLTYAGTNITSDVTAMVESIVYESREQHLSDEIQVTLEDGKQVWQGPWFPSYGDVVTLAIGYFGTPLLPCGSFQVDEVALTGPPDRVDLRCIAAGITPALRTPVSAAFENQTLEQIASAVAQRHGFTLINAPAPASPALSRVTQRQETDLAFLRRLANAYDYDFSAKGSQLVFYPRSALASAGAVLSLSRNDITDFHFTARTNQIYQAARVAYQNPFTKSLVSQSASAASQLTGDLLNLPVRSDTATLALARATAELASRNMMQASVQLRMPGTPPVVAGNVITLSGFGQNDGSYLVTTARHLLTRQTGYTTEAEARKLGDTLPLSSSNNQYA
jgi:phage protein D